MLAILNSPIIGSVLDHSPTGEAVPITPTMPDTAGMLADLAADRADLVASLNAAFVDLAIDAAQAAADRAAAKSTAQAEVASDALALDEKITNRFTAISNSFSTNRAAAIAEYNKIVTDTTAFKNELIARIAANDAALLIAAAELDSAMTTAADALTEILNDAAYDRVQAQGDFAAQVAERMGDWYEAKVNVVEVFASLMVQSGLAGLDPSIHQVGTLGPGDLFYRYFDEVDRAWDAAGGTVLDGVQLTLDVLGMIPMVGEAADVASLLLSAARGDKAATALGVASMVPVLGWAAGTGKIAMGVKKIKNAVDSVVGFVRKFGDNGGCFAADELVHLVGPSWTPEPLPATTSAEPRWWQHGITVVIVGAGIFAAVHLQSVRREAHVRKRFADHEEVIEPIFGPIFV